MVITFIEGDIFTSKCQTLVNPVNCMGVMGNGLSKEFKKRFPACEAPYKAACDNHLLQPGKLMIWRGAAHWVLAGLGKLSKKEVKALLVKYLEPLDIPCEVYEMK